MALPLRLNRAVMSLKATFIMVGIFLNFDGWTVSANLTGTEIGWNRIGDRIQTRARRQASFLCMGGKLATNILQQALDLNREAIKRSEPLLIGTYQLGAFDLKNGRLFNAYTTNVFSEVKVHCLDKIIYLWAPLALQEPQVLFDLAYLTNIDAGEFLLYLDRIYLNITLAIPRPPKQPDAKSRVTKLRFLGTPGIGFRSPNRGPLSAILSTALNVLLRTFKWPAERIVEIIVEDLTKRFVQNNDLPL